MNIPEQKIHTYLNVLLQSAISFVLYRLPWTDDPILVLQTTGEPQIFSRLHDLNGQKGFVMYPFESNELNPPLLIRKDATATGWEAIAELLEKTALNLEPYTHKFSESPVDEHIAKQHYIEAFDAFANALRNKDFRKLVLSRKQAFHISPEFDVLQIFVKACNSYPRMMISLCHTPINGTWMGATPEILLMGNDGQWQTVALAGTMPMNGELMPTHWSEKNKEEQEIVAEFIRKVIRKFGTKLQEKGPYTARAGQLVHLRTDFFFGMKEQNHLGDFLDELYPTPAICGLPKNEAQTFICTHEGYSRTYYAGIIGEINPEEKTRLYINLRCMHIGIQEAVLYAGGGILPSSDAESEWEETKHKMHTMRNLF